ncbi:hypothetical protein GQ457_17G007330 [Hibiscus cannabinus]
MLVRTEIWTRIVTPSTRSSRRTDPRWSHGEYRSQTRRSNPRSALLERERKLESLVSGAQNHNNNNAVLKQVCKPKPFTNTQVIGSYPTRQNQGQFHDSLNIPLRSNPRLTRGRAYDSLDIAKHNLINIWLITHPTKPRSISRLTQHPIKVEPTTHSGSPRSSHDSLSGMLRSNL